MRPLAMASLVLTACADKVTQPGGLRMERVEGLVPGATARLLGNGLKAVNMITVGGEAVQELVVVSSNEATFRVPTLRPCETDGRIVDIVANGEATLRAPLTVPGVISMAVGESRILEPEMLTCLRLPARDEDYVLSAVRTTIPEGDVEVIKRMLFFRTWTDGTAQPVWARSSQVSPFSPELAPVAPSPTYVYSTNPVPFDSRYATAEEGQTVTMVDWRFNAADNATLCQQPKSQVPIFSARVVAATQRVVIVVDPRHPQAAAFLDPSSNGWLRDAAQMVESVLLPTMRSVFDPAFQPLAGGSGRFYAVLTTMGGGTGFAYDGILPGATGGSQAVCPHSSEMTTVRLNATAWAAAQSRDASRLAGTLIHEYAHNVDARVHLRAGRPSTYSWFLGEAWATVAEETAARLASAQPEGAVRSKVTAQMPYPGSAFLGLWGKQEVSGPWQVGGRYTVSAQMLMFLRELSGEVSTTRAATTTLHQRLYAEPRNWADHKSAAPALAAAVGLTYAELVERHAFAAMTAGLLPDNVIVARNLPSFRSWNLKEFAATDGPLNPSFNGRISRTRNEYFDQWIPDGGYAALYAMADANKGLSLAFLGTPDPTGTVRLTRLR